MSSSFTENGSLLVTDETGLDPGLRKPLGTDQSMGIVQIKFGGMKDNAPQKDSASDTPVVFT
jgi:hypothetical protein